MASLKGAGLIAFNVMIKHMADVQETLCRIISEKYGLDIEEMMEAVVGDPRWYAIEQPDLLREIAAFEPIPVVAEVGKKKKSSIRIKKKGIIESMSKMDINE
jgi:hypothetical protein